MAKFAAHFGYTRRTDLDLTFRFNDRLLDVSSKFVQKNPVQLRKQLRTRSTRSAPALEILPNKNPDFEDLYRKIRQESGRGGKISLLLLGRYNFNEPSEWSDWAKEHPDVEAEFLTVHRSKGLEADYVVVLDVSSGRYGFPSRIQNDPVMDMVWAAEDDFEFAEERRLFYVALTRARKKVFLCAPTKSMSIFAKELLGAEYEGQVKQEEEQGVIHAPCPSCETNELIRVKTKKAGSPWVCSAYPYCDGVASLCRKCSVGPLVSRGGSMICAMSTCAESYITCPKCHDGILVSYETRKGTARRCSERECGYRMAPPKQSRRQTRASSNETRDPAAVRKDRAPTPALGGGTLKAGNRCHHCRTGTLRTYRAKKGWTIGCSNRECGFFQRLT
jgi:DNA helicase IV